MHRAPEVKMCGQRRYVVGVMIHVMAAAGLGGAAMAAPVVGDNAIAVLEEEQHLRVPVIGTQRPPMMEDDRLRVLGSPILVENLSAVFRGDRVHVEPLCHCLPFSTLNLRPVLSVGSVFWTIGLRFGQLDRARGLPVTWVQARLASLGNALTRSCACADAAVPRATRPLMPWKIAAIRKKLNAM